MTLLVGFVGVGLALLMIAHLLGLATAYKSETPTARAEAIVHAVVVVVLMTALALIKVAYL